MIAPIETTSGALTTTTRIESPTYRGTLTESDGTYASVTWSGLAEHPNPVQTTSGATRVQVALGLCRVDQDNVIYVCWRAPGYIVVEVKWSGLYAVLATIETGGILPTAGSLGAVVLDKYMAVYANSVKLATLRIAEHIVPGQHRAMLRTDNVMLTLDGLEAEP